DFTTRVYEHLATAAEDVLSGGYNAIVDATFAHRDHRNVLRSTARRMGITACLIQCQAPHEVLARRIAARDLEGKDASEADVTVLNWQKEQWEPVAADEQWALVPVDTTNVDLNNLALRIRAGAA